MFIHLHNHSVYSLLDGIITPDQLSKKAKELEFPAVGLTDHGSMSGSVKFIKACQKNEIKPILGVEGYFVDDADIKVKGEKKLHILLLAKNNNGFFNLMKLMTKANEKFYYKPRIDFDMLEETEGIIVSTACCFGILAHANYIQLVDRLIGRFGDDFYLELMPICSDEQKIINRKAIDLKGKAKLIATNDIHYLEKDDDKSHSLMLKLQHNFSFDVSGLYMRTEKKMLEAFRHIDSTDTKVWEEALANTEEIFEKCNVELSSAVDMALPSVGSNSELRLRAIAEKRKKDLIPDNEVYNSRLKKELEIISEKKFTEYFLIVYDFVESMKKQGMTLGFGRGSAAGSLLCYILGITGLDPIEDGLIFERFLNPERTDWPDIDIDIPRSRRKEAIEILQKKYGKECVANISTFSELKLKSAWKDVARHYGVDFNLSNTISSLLDDERTMVDNYTDNSELRTHFIKIPNIGLNELKLVDAIVGTLRHSSTHAAGIVISPNPINDYGIIEKRGKDESINWDMEDVTFFGLVKIDALALSALDKFGEVLELCGEPNWKEIDKESVYRGFGEGNLAGIFQFNKATASRIVKGLNPTLKRETLIDANALSRPGPLDSGLSTIYTQRYHGQISGISNIYDSYIKDITKETFGVIVYQEQVIRVLTDIAGYSIAKSDQIRKIIGKSKGKEEIEKYREEFIKGCSEKSEMAEAISGKLFDDLTNFSRYAFNKSHAAAYTELAIRQMYFKKNFPTEYMFSQLKWADKEEDKIELAEECFRLGIDLRTPDINYSENEFALKNGSIYIGLEAVKGIGKVAAKEIVTARKAGEFKNVADFRIRCRSNKVNSGHIDTLGRISAFQSMNVSGKSIADNKDVLQELSQFSTGKRKNFDSSNLAVFENSEEFAQEELEFYRQKYIPGVYRVHREPAIGLNLDTEKLEIIRQAIGGCQRCILWKAYHNPVAFSYSSTSNIMLIGEAPGEDENKVGSPFVGRAGKELFKKLHRIGVHRRQCYITNIYKCRPMNNKLPKDCPNECYYYLEKEIKVLQPKLIVALGGTAKEFFTGERAGIKSYCGQIKTECVGREFYPVLYCLHPAALLYSDREEVNQLFENAMMVLKQVIDGRC